MYKAASAYAAVEKAALSGRELEASVLIRAAAQLQSVQDDFEGRRAELDSALSFNRKVWTMLAASATAHDNPLPADIKRNVGSLAVFVFNHSLNLLVEPKAELLAPLISINRSIAAGLRASAG